jgi:hypothetical protein
MRRHPSANRRRFSTDGPGLTTIERGRMNVFPVSLLAAILIHSCRPPSPAEIGEQDGPYRRRFPVHGGQPLSWSGLRPRRRISGPPADATGPDPMAAPGKSRGRTFPGAGSGL